MKQEEVSLPLFYKCSLCGNIVEMIDISGRPLTCCGKEMELLVANTTDGASEKHVPVYDFEQCRVYIQVGSVSHPMSEEHHIEWIELVTDRGIQRKRIYPKEKPTIWFFLGKNEKPLAVYAYCNLHGLWMTECK